MNILREMKLFEGKLGCDFNCIVGSSLYGLAYGYYLVWKETIFYVSNRCLITAPTASKIAAIGTNQYQNVKTLVARINLRYRASLSVFRSCQIGRTIEHCNPAKNIPIPVNQMNSVNTPTPRQKTVISGMCQWGTTTFLSANLIIYP